MAGTRPLILIPSYNTGPILRETIAEAIRHGAPVWVVIDGSTDGSPETIRSFQQSHPEKFRLIELDRNQGKGGAVLHGLRAAVADGFTHVLTMDADGQHPASHIDRFLHLSARHPSAAVFGRPVFDASAPAIRVNGRKISNFWANRFTPNQAKRRRPSPPDSKRSTNANSPNLTRCDARWAFDLPRPTPAARRGAWPEPDR